MGCCTDCTDCTGAISGTARVRRDLGLIRSDIGCVLRQHEVRASRLHCSDPYLRARFGRMARWGPDCRTPCDGIERGCGQKPRKRPLQRQRSAPGPSIFARVLGFARVFGFARALGATFLQVDRGRLPRLSVGAARAEPRRLLRIVQPRHPHGSGNPPRRTDRRDPR